MVTWAVDPASDPASPPTQVFTTTTHDMPLKQAQLTPPPPAPWAANLCPYELAGTFEPEFLSLQGVGRAVEPTSDSASPPTQVVTTTAYHMPLKLAQLPLLLLLPRPLILSKTHVRTSQACFSLFAGGRPGR